MTRPELDQAPWQPWIDHVCAALDIPADQIDVREIHGLTGQVASSFHRAMAPVSAYLWAVAQMRDPNADPGELRDAILLLARSM